MAGAHPGLVCTKGRDPALKSLKSSLQIELWVFFEWFERQKYLKVNPGLHNSCLLAVSTPSPPSRGCPRQASGQVTGWSPSSCFFLREDVQDKTDVIRKLISRAGRRWSVMATALREAADCARGKRADISAKKSMIELLPHRGEHLFMPHPGKIFSFLTRAF